MIEEHRALQDQLQPADEAETYCRGERKAGPWEIWRYQPEDKKKLLRERLVASYHAFIRMEGETFHARSGGGKGAAVRRGSDEEARAAEREKAAAKAAKGSKAYRIRRRRASRQYPNRPAATGSSSSRGNAPSCERMRVY